MTDQLKSLHACWNQVTGQDVHFRATERIWFEMFKMDFTADDLMVVLKDVLAYNKSHVHCPMKVQCHKLCSDLEVFASLLASAKAKARNAIKLPTEKEKTLTAWRGCSPVENGSVHKISEFLRIPTK